MHGTFFKITNPDSGQLVWIAILDEESRHFWVYDHLTGKFHCKPGLAVDYAMDHDLEYTPVNESVAYARAMETLPSIPKQLRAIHAADAQAVPANQVFRSARPIIDDRTAMKMKIKAVSQARPGTWVVWKSYPLASLPTARVAASNLRHHKIKALFKAVGAVEARIVTVQGEGTAEVQVSKSSHMYHAALGLHGDIPKGIKGLQGSKGGTGATVLVSGARVTVTRIGGTRAPIHTQTATEVVHVNSDFGIVAAPKTTPPGPESKLRKARKVAIRKSSAPE